jgi:hypothetical protein
MGCSSGVSADVNVWRLDHLQELVDAGVENARLELCLDDRCEVSDVELHTIWSIGMDPELENGDSLPDSVRLTVTSGDDVLVEDDFPDPPIKKNQPNGPDCEPTCFNGGFWLHRSGELMHGSPP